MLQCFGRTQYIPINTYVRYIYYIYQGNIPYIHGSYGISLINWIAIFLLLDHCEWYNLVTMYVSGQEESTKNGAGCAALFMARGPSTPACHLPPLLKGLLTTIVPKTNSWPLKMDGWNTRFRLGWPVSGSYVIVSGKVLSLHKAFFSSAFDVPEKILMTQSEWSRSMPSKLKWLAIETWPTNSWWWMGSPAGGFNSIFYFYIEMMFHLTCSSIFSGFLFKDLWFIVQTIMFFHDEVSSIGFKDKICRERLPKQRYVTEG